MLRKQAGRKIYICSMSKLVAARLLMIVTILVILFFQGYWLQKVYLEEKVNLQLNKTGEAYKLEKQFLLNK